VYATTGGCAAHRPLAGALRSADGSRWCIDAVPAE
jgi:hypothetical protein